MKIRRRVYYGLANSLRLGSLRDPTTGQAMTPVPSSGDAKVTQDDGTGTNNATNLPTVDGTDLLWIAAAVECTPPTANGADRVLQMYDQGTKAWIDLDVILEIEGVYGFVPAAALSGTTVQLPAGAATALSPLGLTAVVVQSTDPLDIGAQLVITAWVSGTQIATGASGWTRTPTAAFANLGIVLYAQSEPKSSLSPQGKTDVTAAVPASSSSSAIG